MISGGDAAHAWATVWLADPLQITNQLFKCSYAFNMWLDVVFSQPGVVPPHFLNPGNLLIPAEGFAKSGPPRPSQTPVFADYSYNTLNPYDSTNVPSSDLFTGWGGELPAIARHGSQPATAAPQQWNIAQRMPGMIDVALFDGHVEKSPLENLWNYYWTAKWQALAACRT